MDTYAHALVNVADARVIFGALARGEQNFNHWEYKGTPQQNGTTAISRVLSVAVKGENVYVELKSGPGNVTPAGAITPNGPAKVEVNVTFKLYEARWMEARRLNRSFNMAIETTPLLPVELDRFHFFTLQFPLPLQPFFLPAVFAPGLIPLLLLLQSLSVWLSDGHDATVPPCASMRRAYLMGKVAYRSCPPIFATPPFSTKLNRTPPKSIA